MTASMRTTLIVFSALGIKLKNSLHRIRRELPIRSMQLFFVQYTWTRAVVSCALFNHESKRSLFWRAVPRKIGKKYKIWKHGFIR